jgi:uncharacterized protein DUF6582
LNGAEEDPRRPDADPRHGIEKYGETTFADPVNKKYPSRTFRQVHGRGGPETGETIFQSTVTQFPTGELRIEGQPSPTNVRPIGRDRRPTLNTAE